MRGGSGTGSLPVAAVAAAEHPARRWLALGLPTARRPCPPERSEGSLTRGPGHSAPQCGLKMRVGAVAVLVALLALPALPGSAVDIILEPSQTYQRLFGYGQGSMDQANVLWFANLSAEARAEVLDRLYTLGYDGLGLTICRTYICAGDAPGHRHMDRRPSGSPAPLGYELKDQLFRWQGHEASLWHAQGAAARGAFMVAFWNSPPYWLTISGCTAGAAAGWANLRTGAEERFAQHICEVLAHYRDVWGVDFDRVSPINEPEANWWQEGGGQEGCHVEPDQAGVLMAALGRRLAQAGLRTRVQGPEAAMAGSLDYLDRLLANPGAYEALAELTCHQYITDFHDLRRWPLRGRLHGKPVWMSEWGDWTNRGMDLALNYARKLQEAHRVMQAPVWCMWEPGFLFHVEGGRATPKEAYYAVAQFTRFARPGMSVIEATDTTLRTAAYLDGARQRLVIVTINDTAEAAAATYDLSAFEGLHEVSVWRTAEGERLTPSWGVARGDRLTVDLPSRSITTLMAPYARIRPPLLRNGGFETRHLRPWRSDPPAQTGVQDNYPQGGSYDGFINLTPNAGGRIWQVVRHLKPGGRYTLTAACATSGIEATLAVRGAGLNARTAVQGGAYALHRVEFAAPADGEVTVEYAAGPATAEGQWVTLDNVRLSPGVR